LDIGLALDEGDESCENGAFGFALRLEFSPFWQLSNPKLFKSKGIAYFVSFNAIL